MKGLLKNLHFPLLVGRGYPQTFVVFFLRVAAGFGLSLHIVESSAVKQHGGSPHGAGPSAMGQKIYHEGMRCRADPQVRHDQTNLKWAFDV